MKENINEHDMTKKMMDIVRGGFKNKLITENEEDDFISPTPSDAIFQDQLKKLKDVVNSSAQITNFKIYPNDMNVIIEGTFLKRATDDSGITFKMELTGRDIETSMDNIDLDSKVNEILKRLTGFYEVWQEEWNRSINDYKIK